LDITEEQIAAAEQLFGLSFSAAERQLMLDGLTELRDRYAQLRQVQLPNDIAPALLFHPQPLPPAGPGASAADEKPSPAPAADRAPSAAPADLEALAFAPVNQLAELLRTRQVSSVALTEMYLRRLRRYDPALQCVVTLTDELALAQARRADDELAAGRYRGRLHGIPWGAKDLLATHGIRTTWGATPFQEQLIDMDATVVQRLEQAGAVLVAKLTMGELAWGDVWFGGTTKNPWSLAEGSSGSSAGSAAATAAGLVGFAIGTETHGSIVSPSARCGATGLRPSFGRVSRAGAMALSWSMDKIGPICRSAEDCALVFEAIYGPDGQDGALVDRPFEWRRPGGRPNPRVGYLSRAFEQEREGRAHDQQTLETLRALGAELVPIELPDYPVQALGFILFVEAAAAFDELTRSGRDDLLVRQVQEAWPNMLRLARLIPAVEYIQANRVRALIMRAMADLMETVDLYVAPASGGDNLLLTNLTGHPAVVLPNGFSASGTPTSITFVGRLYDEATLLSAATAYQDATDFHLAHPVVPIASS
jgi:Asp-tRNA(Asn)/Glu-tRNA(Gln) amidotransferase A subunit family amidase